ncbi:RNA-guided endonuclease InsQ/TnpB family protein [Stutzerimonas stutzeri]|uniref:RNA-guided endonuclease InsQ/TnpB family protein n=1 Tax=Stutzerimonas stutzeri TaxID=316 RepID=UPI001E720718|nr:transposase [Stutzerimonas stutzeri]CAB5555732.1 transposase, IS605 OrfB family [Stutzerimonas stutzeri]CAB5597680.1 transposase, IS605 OrfB family [Stutzerimonas stutzeri]CAC9158302.1 transposase, IS605 OrfB family [Stutzerimonas stutzeri]CAD0188271.1 Mobilization_integration [Stutzerimonas stutzeri]
MKHTKTLKLRIKDRHSKVLRLMAREVNLVWNYCNETSHRAIRERHQWLSGFDLQKYTNGLSKCDGILIGSPTVQQVCEDYAKARRQFKKSKLRWRVSNPNSSKRSLGWVPFKARALRYRTGQILFAGHAFGLWDRYGLGQYQLRAGSFSEDARGRWYLNVVVEVEARLSTGQQAIGIDLGLKDVATCSDGSRLENGRFYRDLEPALAVAQRAGKKARVRALHAKIANRRKDALHQFSRALVERCNLIVVGDVSPTKLAKTTMAKSVLDAGWGQLKTMLAYKCEHAGIDFKVVGEAYTTQTCSCCGALPDSRPRGIAGLGIRAWTCACGVTHDRDINAARNILALGHERPAVGIPLLSA